MTRLNQIVALEAGVRQTAQRESAILFDVLTKEGPLSGLTRTYHPFTEDGLARPSERKDVQFTVQQILDRAAETLTRVLDLTLTKDHANTYAKADLRVGDNVIASDVPVTYLIWLEKQLAGLQAVLRALPTLDPAFRWELDPATGRWATEEIKTLSTERNEVPLVLYEATPQHPAQVKTVARDVPVGEWTLRKFSGAVSQEYKDRVVGKITDLLDAVKVAREEANSVAVTDRQVGGAIFDWLLA